jgi:hypothetical protein
VAIKIQGDRCMSKLNELPFEKSIPKTPSEIFLAIDNQSVNRSVGESLIERYGDRRVMEAIADLQEKMGIELSEEVGKRIINIGQFIDEFYGMMIKLCPEKRKGKK